MKKHCPNCAYFSSVNEEQGECRLNPPVFFIVHERIQAKTAVDQNGKEIGIIGQTPSMLVPSTKCAWPIVLTRAWCGQFEAALPCSHQNPTTLLPKDYGKQPGDTTTRSN